MEIQREGALSLSQNFRDNFMGLSPQFVWSVSHFKEKFRNCSFGWNNRRWRKKIRWRMGQGKLFLRMCMFNSH